MAGFTIFRYEIGIEAPSNITAQGVTKVVIYRVPDWVYEGTALHHFVFMTVMLILEEVLATNYAML